MVRYPPPLLPLCLVLQRLLPPPRTMTRHFLRWTPSALPSWRRTSLRLCLPSSRVWSPFLPWGVISRDGPSLSHAATVLGGLWGALVRSTLPHCLPWHLHVLLDRLGPHLALLNHGRNLASSSQAGLLLLSLAVFPLQLVMGGIMAVRLFVHLPHHPYMLGFFMGDLPPPPPLPLGLCGPQDIHLGRLFWGALLLFRRVGGLTFGFPFTVSAPIFISWGVFFWGVTRLSCMFTSLAWS